MRNSFWLAVVLVVASGCTGETAGDDGSSAGAGQVGRGGASGSTASGGTTSGASGGAGSSGRGGDAGHSGGAGGSLPLDAPRPTPGPDDGTVPMFVGVGKVGRVTVSCDDGESWVYDHSDDDTLRCSSDGSPPDCDHAVGAPSGLAYGNGRFVVARGWGTDGALSYSEDGVNYTTTYNGADTHGALLFAGDRFLAARHDRTRTWREGASWQEGADPGFADDMYNVRSGGYTAYDGGRVLLYNEEGERDELRISSDGGESFGAPDEIPETCRGKYVAAGGGVWIIGGVGGRDASRSSRVCHSQDGGRTWQQATLPEGAEQSSPFVWTGELFVFYGYPDGNRFESADGKTWTSKPTKVLRPSGASTEEVGALWPPAEVVARSSATGTWVAARGGSDWYDKQVFYRSQDGITWYELETGKYTKSHPMSRIVFGWAKQAGPCAQ